jgi:prepilin-type processing-associated H-X9-DG protein
MESGDRNNALAATTADSEYARAGQRGAFVAHKKLGFRDILDGTANTIFGGEINTDLGDEDVTTAAAMNRNDPATGVKARPRDCVSSNLLDPLRPRFWVTGTQTLTSVRGATVGRGFQWIHGEHLYTGMNTIIPPNGTVCYQGDWAGQEGAIPPSSRHPGGVHILMGDGAVRFITDSIESGNQNERNVEFGLTGNSKPGSKSPYGLWGALGTRANKEILTGDF